MTTNPTIFASALAKGDRYDDQLADLADRHASVDTAVIRSSTSAGSGSSDLEHVGRRPPRGADDQAPALRLGSAAACRSTTT